MTPVYKDAFTVPGLGIVVFHRDPAGRPVELGVVQDRVWDCGSGGVSRSRAKPLRGSMDARFRGEQRTYP
jgi:hypothetical protein